MTAPSKGQKEIARKIDEAFHKSANECGVGINLTEVIALALQEAEKRGYHKGLNKWEKYNLVKIAVENEREACAKVADKEYDFWMKRKSPYQARGAFNTGKAIRSRSEKPQKRGGG